MILVTGGAYQGKQKFAESLGKETVFGGFQNQIKEWADNGVSQAEMQNRLEKLLSEYPNAVFVMNEIGCGIVPMRAEDRYWRDLAGQAGQFLAERAEAVYRVVCGIGMQIKQEESGI